ncbi:MAG: hypothetical protein Q7T51_00330, partial [Candidatus Moranbacteria bacterium]|nr:hypothetical protein [Candidatus Moranbacteria bacterium]
MEFVIPALSWNQLGLIVQPFYFCKIKVLPLLFLSARKSNKKNSPPARTKINFQLIREKIPVAPRRTSI